MNAHGGQGSRARRITRVGVAALLLASFLTIGAAAPAGAAGRFVDDDGNVHEGYIEAIVEAGITNGCGPTTYCPSAPVTRAQMATFLTRALELPAAEEDYFIDDNTSVHEDNINAVAQAGITGGVGGDRYDPNGTVRRAQMATFLTRAFDLPPTEKDYFTDDSTSVHEDSINRVAEAGIAGGVGGSRYSPAGTVNRGQMATFLGRALELDPIVPLTGDHLAADRSFIVDQSGATVVTDATVNINGETYPDSLYFTSCGGCGFTKDGSVEFDLGRDYELFTTAIGLSDSAQAGESARLQILADGVVLFERVFSLGQSELLELDVRNVLRLEFRSSEGSVNRLFPSLGTPIVWRR